jgi:hypothetical protein
MSDGDYAMTKRTYPDLPMWVFNIDEVSAGVYEVIARDDQGYEISEKGIDVADAIENCKQRARELTSHE